jgi:hypothetical protein
LRRAAGSTVAGHNDHGRFILDGLRNLDEAAPADSAASVAARLRIHAEGALGDAGPAAGALRRLRARYPGGPRPAPHVPLRLRVEDLQGRRLRAIDTAGALTEFPLPAGTYHVTAILGLLRRRYTMTLEPGRPFDLHLHFATHRP